MNDGVRPFARIEISLEKLRDYCLSQAHPRGRHKARVFLTRLGLTAENARWLEGLLETAAREREDELIPGVRDRYGERFRLDLEISTCEGTAIVRSLWFHPVGEDVLRFISCYVL